MKTCRTALRLSANLAVLFAFAIHCEQVIAQSPQFNRDVRPILASKCFACHGPDEDHREADLRLDHREDAIDSGAIEPGDAGASELVRRILSSDEDEVMPPPHADNALDDAQKQTLKRWVESGAEYEQHWAFVPPVRPTPPDVGQDWSRNPIDQFVLARLQEEKLRPTAEANRYTLVRRLYLDLIGLPPTIEQADAFVNSKDPDAYEKLVDQLLASKRYGEHWATPWLDLARYSDTNGYEKDRGRSIWPYRDWVIRSLNSDTPFDQFTVAQIAGDMLPTATADDLIATGFHRNTMLNEEGGIDPLEYRYMAMVDRVATTGTVWLGLTTGCAQCHTHKYDPITHTDYFQLMALLNNADEPDFAIPEESIASNRTQLQQEIAKLETGLVDQFPAGEVGREKNLETKFESWLKDNRDKVSAWQPIAPSEMKSNLPKLSLQDDASIFASGDATKRDQYEVTFEIADSELPITAIRLEALPDDRLPDRGPGLTYYEGRKGDFFVSELDATFGDMELVFASASHTYSKLDETNAKLRPDNVFDGDGSTGWQPGNNKGQRLQLVMNLAEPIRKSGKLKIKLLFERHYVASLGRFRFSVTSNNKATANNFSEETERLLTRADFTDGQRSTLQRQFLLTTPLLADARKPINELRKKLPELTETLVMRERPADHPRETFRHHRGEWLSPREKVSPGIIELFADNLDPSELPTNRLEFARWLVSDENPLIARVTVNRAWRSIFGYGLMRTSGDFGVQSESPTHPNLLDWLAVDFVENGWSLKRLHKQIVMSATYRQSSAANQKLIDDDPANRLFARATRYRRSGETVRDTMLRASGLLSKKMFGPGVFPPQPESVTALAYGGFKWTPSSGEDRFRRSVYTFKKRTAAFAGFTVFDAPTGENCIARRNLSNTPLQALTVLNDEMFLEMSRALALLAAKQQFDTPEITATFIFRRVLTRPPSDQERNALLEYFEEQLHRFEAKQLDAKLVNASDDANTELAAWSMVARVVMNLDEAITRN